MAFLWRLWAIAFAAFGLQVLHVQALNIGIGSGVYSTVRIDKVICEAAILPAASRFRCFAFLHIDLECIDGSWIRALDQALMCFQARGARG